MYFYLPVFPFSFVQYSRILNDHFSPDKEKGTINVQMAMPQRRQWTGSQSTGRNNRKSQRKLQGAL